MALGKPLSLFGLEVTVGPLHAEWATAHWLQWSRRQPHPPRSFLVFPPFLPRAERERAGQPGERPCGIVGSALGLPSGILSWRFSRWAVSARLGTSVLSPPNSSCLPTAPRMNPKLLTMALHDPSHRPHLLPSLPLAHGPPATLAPAFPPSPFASGPLYWLFLLPGTLFSRPSHCWLLLEFGAPAEMPLFRAVSPTT